MNQLLIICAVPLSVTKQKRFEIFEKLTFVNSDLLGFNAIAP